MDRIVNTNNLFVKQTRRGCFQEMLGCEAKTEFNIATQQHKDQNILYALEESSCLIRTCCPGIRDWKMEVSVDKASPPFIEVERPLRCAPAPMKCCCYQEVITRGKTQGGTGKDLEVLGSIKEEFFCCVPRFAVFDAAGAQTHVIHQPKCCGGLCVDVFREGCCNCRVPFYVFPVTKGADNSIKVSEQHNGSIVKVWAGLATELFTDADNFELHFPEKADVKLKSNLLGGVFLINQLFFEGKNEGK